MPYRIYLGDPSTSFESEYIISRPHQHRLVLHQEHRIQADVEAVVNGDAELALFAEGICVILLCRFADREWTAVGIPWFPSADALTAAGGRRGSPSALLIVTLVQQDLVRALRVIDLPERFASVFRRVMAELAEATWPGLSDYLALARALIVRPGSLDRMLKLARVRVVDHGEFDSQPVESVLLETPEDL
jgi:hypothetical protein